MKKTTRQYIVPAYKVIELGEDILQVNPTSDTPAIYQPDLEDTETVPGQW